MTFHAILLVIHILSSVVWLSILPADMVLRQFINTNKGKSGERKLIEFYLKFTNKAGTWGMIGVLLTGIIMVSIIPYYSFFQFSANHWLATKQVIMVIIIIVIAGFLIPRAKKVRIQLTDNLESSAEISSSFYNDLNKLWMVSTIVNVLALVNFLLAITHRFF
jgi:hypothetical protein